MTYCIDLSGKVAIVTGSTKGLGRAMAEGLARAGAAVVISSRKQALCDQVASDLAAATGVRAVGIACNVSDWEAVPALVDRAMTAFGRIDVLVNNAGINPVPSSLHDIDLGLWRKIFSVNLEGPLRTSQLIAPIMREQGGGSIVNIASFGAYTPGPGVAAYGASKAALINLTRSMAREWAAWRVRVNAISPGPIRSEMTEGAERNLPGFYQRSGAATMMKRVADTNEIIGPVVYLASDASSFVTGEDHLVTGGLVRG